MVLMLFQLWACDASRDCWPQNFMRAHAAYITGSIICSATAPPAWVKFQNWDVGTDRIRMDSLHLLVQKMSMQHFLKGWWFWVSKVRHNSPDASAASAASSFIACIICLGPVPGSQRLPHWPSSLGSHTIRDLATAMLDPMFARRCWQPGSFH